MSPRLESKPSAAVLQGWQQAQESNDNQIGSNHIVQDLGPHEDQYARENCNDRL